MLNDGYNKMNGLEIFILRSYREAMLLTNQYSNPYSNPTTAFRSLCLILVLLLAACQSTAVTPVAPVTLFHDDLLPEYRNVYIESEQHIFSLGDEAKFFVDQKLQRFNDQDGQIKALAEGIFNHSELSLLYQNDANTVANETFENKAANCLSLTIMTYAMADYAGLGVRFQQVSTPELWVRREGTSVLNRHVNLRLYPKTATNIILYNANSYQLDFDRRTQSLRLPVIAIKRGRVIAMFYNNKGADALIKGNYPKAYAYFRAALITAPQLIEAWTNLGILYRRLDRLDYAENSYQQALTIDHNDPTTWENLAYLYTLTNREQQADSILKRVNSRRLENPYYHFMLGDVEYEKKNWSQAISHYRQAISLNKKVHEFYFAVAKSYYQLGDIKRSQRFMALAKKNTHSDNDDLFYQSKISFLNKLNQ